MPEIDHSVINNLAQSYLNLTARENELSIAQKHKLQIEKNRCIQDLAWFVIQRAGKYKKFSNYEDLKQDGQEALLMALRTYNPEKGNFFSWAHYYIKTKLSRKANKHSTIHFPMAYAKDNKPHKMAELPVQIDEVDLLDKVSQKELNSKLLSAVNSLPDLHQQILTQTYGLGDAPKLSRKKILHNLGLNNPQYQTLLQEAQKMVCSILQPEKMT